MSARSSQQPSPEEDISNPLDVPRQAWRVRGQLQDYLFIRRRDLTVEETGTCAPAVFILAELDRWLTSLFTRRVCYELYETVTGIQLSGLLLNQRPIDPALLKRRLAEAFHSRELVALPLGPIRRRRSSGHAGGSGGAGPTPIVVPFLPDADEQKTEVKENNKKKEKEEELAWVAVKLIDEDGKPVGGARYRVLLPNGEMREGKLDSQGYARVDGIAEGAHKISFPDFDSTAWKASN